jgi:phosphoglycolate phosphatase
MPRRYAPGPLAYARAVPEPLTGPVVGFDLDMTLVDSADGIVATLALACAEQGVTVDADAVRATIGVPLETALLAIAPTLDPVATAARYRELYAEHGVGPTVLLPGAAEAVEAVHALGGRVLVVSTKVEPAVRAVLAHVGLAAGRRAPDLVVGGLFAAAKGVRLAAEQADVYVGDHPGDVEAAKVAGATSVAVATGPHPAADLAAAGADVVLADLTTFPAWLAGLAR